jgi:hypothetical protein
MPKRQQAEMGPPRGEQRGGRSTRSRVRLRRGLLGLIGVLYLLSIPWYRDDPGELRLILGLPDWVATALLCYVAVAVLNAAAWLLTDVVDPEPAEDPARAAGEDPADEVRA